MTSHIFAACIDIDHAGKTGPIAPIQMPIAPQKALSRTYYSDQQAPHASELDKMKFGVVYTGPPTISAVSSEPTNHSAPEDLEMSRPTTPELTNEVELLQSFSNPPVNKMRMLTACVAVLSAGLNDSAPGALIPYIETHYDIGYAIVSLIFISNALGWISAAFFLDVLRARLGRARTLILGNALIICGYVPILFTPPFPVVVACFFPLGLGTAFNLALLNVFVANLQNSMTLLGIMHGSYGVGGTIGPIIATAMTGTGGLIWSRFYLLPLSFSTICLVISGWSFWTFETENLNAAIPLTSLRQSVSPPTTQSPISSRFASMLRAFRTPTVLLGALFIFAYQGAEVSISGWVVSFLLTSRAPSSPSSIGFVTSGFWLGITLGRFFLSAPAHRVGEKLFVYLVVAGAAAFQLLVWLVPNVVGDAVAVAIVGLLLGPVYPCATVVFSRAISKTAQVSSLSVISAFGSSGGAVAPFTTGILAQVVGTFVLHPIAIGLFTMMVACWWRIPDAKKRRE